MTELYLGLISGTSMDGVDSVLTELDERDCRIRHAATFPYPHELHVRLHRLIEDPTISLVELGALDTAVGRFFADAALRCLEEAGVERSAVTAIGHHGQTVYHRPTGTEPFTLQIGDPNALAVTTGVTTIADFRRMDVALGGQGAPLVPAFHAWRFRSPDTTRVVVNIGGIANITVLTPQREPLGFDTGPGNTLLDGWIRRCRDEPLDRDGAWSASGRVDAALLHRLLDEPFFALPAPKSTGREQFHMDWLAQRLAGHGGTDADIQATLAELTAVTIANAIATSAPDCSLIIVCGGGAYNDDLMQRLRLRTRTTVASSTDFGILPDWVEGAAFAWLARARLHNDAGNVPSVTGAHRSAVLGGVYWAKAP